MNIPFGLSPARIYVYAGVALAFAAVLAFAGCEHSNASALRADNRALMERNAELVDADVSKVETINTQSAALDEWVKLAGTPDDLRNLLKAARAALDGANKELADMQAAKEKDRAHPECGALLGGNLERACPTLAAGLRRIAAGRHEDGGGEGTGPGGEAAAGGTHGGLRAALPLPEH